MMQSTIHWRNYDINIQTAGQKPVISSYSKDLFTIVEFNTSTQNQRIQKVFVPDYAGKSPRLIIL
ncbi:hypothetical protein BKA69DRAFT_1046295 [Paraphysoderma sedebokerense]|nr:hypothetical protein BKA69DRAFT_1046295 [Paraphysoderma sedebokerense]